MAREGSATATGEQAEAVVEARGNLLRGLHDYSVARADLRWAMGETPWE